MLFTKMAPLNHHAGDVWKLVDPGPPTHPVFGSQRQC